MRENEGTCVTGSPPEQSARGRGQRRTEGGFYRTNSHFDHLSLHTARSLCIRWIPAHFVPPLQGPLSSRTNLHSNHHTPGSQLESRRSGRERETQLRSPVSDERRKIFMADNRAGDDDDDVSGNSRDMSSRFCVIDNGGDRRFDVGLSNRFRCALRSHCTPQTVMVFVAVVLGREQQDGGRSSAAADCLRTRSGSMGRRN